MNHINIFPESQSLGDNKRIFVAKILNTACKANILERKKSVLRPQEKLCHPAKLWEWKALYGSYWFSWLICWGHKICNYISIPAFPTTGRLQNWSDSKHYNQLVWVSAAVCFVSQNDSRCCRSRLVKIPCHHRWVRWVWLANFSWI